ncbi:hypothetical protein BI004_gp007 [Bacillus phage NotTheCreek]|uniref:Uncharacterized protein n=1 Tax=Bacillus phage PPIsBest TaxID=2024234 RepID=A0A222Z3P6_9CAUD|nr:hypothetical protein BI004_gp007 [Bacillus phage NotTheCreek]AMW63228.1 hypothetical protein NOTTHECREEK_7 [Bacillus phage NotTheCreek]ASR78215.1 hypothetical protein PPISBEST_7 [Bacillus phage PPIsBest]QDH49993.1 hypothetical protein ALPS_6 [Bacillus phage ALPS]
MLALAYVLGCMVLGYATFYIISEIVLAVLEGCKVGDETFGYRLIGGTILTLMFIFTLLN